MKLPDFPKPPPALDPTITYRETMIEADVESPERMRKAVKVQGFTIYCDESERVGALIENAENGCFTMQALVEPVPFTSTVSLNSTTLTR